MTAAEVKAAFPAFADVALRFPSYYVWPVARQRASGDE